MKNRSESNGEQRFIKSMLVLILLGGSFNSILAFERIRGGATPIRAGLLTGGSG